jgi:hypothetical protein
METHRKNLEDPSNGDGGTEETGEGAEERMHRRNSEQR